MKEEDFSRYVETRNGTLIGYHTIPFPVYVVHVGYDSFDSDPFFPIYRAILQYVEVDPRLETLPYFARIIGFDLELLKRCIRFLRDQEMLRLHEDVYVLSEDAQRKYINPNSRPTVRVTGSFLVDGKNLELLPEVVYRTERKLHNWDDNISAHLPIDPELDGAPFGKLLKKLRSPKTLQLLRLEPDGNNFEVLSTDKKFLIGAFALYYVNAEGNIVKELVYGNESISCEALGSPARYIIHMICNKKKEWRFVANLGFSVEDSEEISQTAVSSQNDGWDNILAERYSFPRDTVVKMLYAKTTGLPIVELTESLFRVCANPQFMVDDCRRGYIEFPVFPQGRVRFSIRHNLSPIVDFCSLLDHWKDWTDKPIGEFAEIVNTEYPDWRALMVRLNRLDELEHIDCARFILN